MAVIGPITGFNTTDSNTGNTQDLGRRYVSKDYLIDVYPTIASSAGDMVSPGLWTWGSNSGGQLGLASLTHRSSPIQVGTLTNWKQVGCGDLHVSATTTDGTLFAWGRNAFGQLGLNDITDRSSPVAVGALTNWKLVIGGEYHTIAIKTDGTLWTWGANSAGQLGSLNTTTRSSPAQVGSLTTWRLISCGTYHTVATRTDGTLWVWGQNTSAGVLGLSDTTNRSSPVQVGTGTNWKQISCGRLHTAAVKHDGTLWVWGHNTFGQLGLLDIAHRSSPVQVGTGTNWKKVSCGGAMSSAITTDGTLWVWGRNGSGQLGQADLVHRSSPVQVGSLTNWKESFVISFSMGNESVFSIKTDGTLWAWGNNQSGSLGLRTSGVNTSSPAQVGTLTNWKSVSGGGGLDGATLGARAFAIQDGYY